MFIPRVLLPITNTAFALCRTSLVFPKSDQNPRFSISSTHFHSSNKVTPWQTSLLNHSTLASTFQRRRCATTNAKSKGNTLGEQKWVHEGLITESLANGMFRVRLDNEDLIIGYVSGRIRCKFILVIPGDRVKIEVSRYDSTRGRIIYRLGGSKDSKG